MMDEYPEITFVSTAVRQTDDSTFEVTGDLTIKDVTKSVTIEFEYAGAAKDPFGNQRLGFEGSTAISRKDFGITWNVALETGGVLVSDKVTLEFEVSAIKTA
jgi:polyisoprenoid-binding protein YceI